MLTFADLNQSIRNQFAVSETMSEKFTKLKVESDLQLSVLAGLVELGGHGNYLTEESNSNVGIIYFNRISS